MTMLYTSRLVCPKCKAGIAVQSGHDYSLVSCPCCGSKFRLIELSGEGSAVKPGSRRGVVKKKCAR